MQRKMNKKEITEKELEKGFKLLKKEAKPNRDFSNALWAELDAKYSASAIDGPESIKDRTSIWQRLFVLQPRLAGAAMAVLVLTSTTTYAYTSERVVNGDLLYPVKRAVEQVEQAVSSDKVAYYEKMANRRVKEVEYLREEERRDEPTEEAAARMLELAEKESVKLLVEDDSIDVELLEERKVQREYLRERLEELRRDVQDLETQEAALIKDREAELEREREEREKEKLLLEEKRLELEELREKKRALENFNTEEAEKARELEELRQQEEALLREREEAERARAQREEELRRLEQELERERELREQQLGEEKRLEEQRKVELKQQEEFERQEELRRQDELRLEELRRQQEIEAENRAAELRRQEDLRNQNSVERVDVTVPQTSNAADRELEEALRKASLVEASLSSDLSTRESVQKLAEYKTLVDQLRSKELSVEDFWLRVGNLTR